MNGDDEEDLGSQDSMDINVIILMFPKLPYPGNMVTHKARRQVGCVKMGINTYKFSVMNICSNI